MTWRIDGPTGNELFKVRWEIVKWTRGRGLDLGSGVAKTYNHWIGVDNCKDTQLFGQPIKPDVVCDCEKLDVFASQSMDFCVSSHLLEHIEPERVAATLKEWLRVIKPKGYLVLYLPDENQYPKIGEPGANPDHRWNVNYERVIEYMREAGSWDLLDYQVRSEGNEYSLYFVFQKVGSGQHFSYRKPKPAKICGVVRYGAIGDLLQASSVFAGLKAQGYHITLYCSPPGDEVVKHDPNVDEFYIQGKDQVPNQFLGEYWDYHAKKYDKWVNLSESVEGSFLALPGRALHGWPPTLRHSLLNRNYLEVQHEIAGVKHVPQVHFYATNEERDWARKERAKMGDFVVALAIGGSSVHKRWPYIDQLIAATMIDFKHVDIVMIGDEAGKILEQGWENEKRVHRRCGAWGIRQSLAFMEQADFAIGAETGVMNAASQLPYPKIVFLSHSTEENLTRDWIDTLSLFGPETHCPGRGNNEAPACHQLHYSFEHCKATEFKAAQCMSDISADAVYKVLWQYLTHKRSAVA